MRARSVAGVLGGVVVAAPVGALVAVGILAGVLAGACSVVSPPPLVARHDAPEAAREGDVRILLLVGVGGGIWVDGGFGLALRASVQASDTVEAGGDLTVAFNLETDEQETDEQVTAEEPSPEGAGSPAARPAGPAARRPQIVTAFRGFGRFNPGSLSWLALDAGAGVGFSDTGIVWLTADTGALAGHAFDLAVDGADPGGRFVLYGGPLLAVSLPVARGAPLAERAEAGARYASATFWYGGSLGFGVTSGSALDVGSTLEATALGALSADDSAALFLLSLGTNAAFVP